MSNKYKPSVADLTCCIFCGKDSLEVFDSIGGHWRVHCNNADCLSIGPMGISSLDARYKYNGIFTEAYNDDIEDL